MRKQSEVEYRCYGLYSEVSKATGYTSEQIDTVYSWYINKTIASAIEKPSCQIYFKNLGMLQLNLSTALNTLNKNTFSLEESLEEYLDGNRKEYVTESFLNKRVKGLIRATNSLKERVNFVREKEVINETRYMNVTTRIEKVESKLNQLYESIQRIPEYEQKRTAECRQSASRSNEQNSELFQTIEP
jgi:hypothetical protein